MKAAPIRSAAKTGRRRRKTRLGPVNHLPRAASVAEVISAAVRVRKLGDGAWLVELLASEFRAVYAEGAIRGAQIMKDRASGRIAE